MTSKSQARRNKQQRGTSPAPDAMPAPKQPTARPTDQRLARGHWSAPDDRLGGAYVDRACDMIGRLLVSAQITQQQAQAARVFSEVYAAYRAEIGVSESKSCLAESSGGFDASDGDPETYKRYYAICEKLGAALSATLKNECGKMDGDKPRSIEALRAALDRLTA